MNEKHAAEFLSKSKWLLDGGGEEDDGYTEELGSRHNRGRDEEIRWSRETRSTTAGSPTRADGGLRNHASHSVWEIDASIAGARRI